MITEENYRNILKELREEILQLRLWAMESYSGGWSTHHVEPMRCRADYLENIVYQAERKL